MPSATTTTSLTASLQSWGSELTTMKNDRTCIQLPPEDVKERLYGISFDCKQPLPEPLHRVLQDAKHRIEVHEQEGGSVDRFLISELLTSIDEALKARQAESAQ